jgi:large subunit ribosomal protein L1
MADTPKTEGKTDGKPEGKPERKPKGEGKPEHGKPEHGKPEHGKPEHGKPEHGKKGPPAAAAAEAAPAGEGQAAAPAAGELGGGPKRERSNRPPRKPSRRYKQALAKLGDRTKLYTPEDGFKLLKSLQATKFEEAVEVAVRIGIDPKKTEQLVRGSVSLPKGIGKTIKIAVFAEGDKAKEAQAAGADFVGGKDLADKIEGGFTDFDMTIAAPDMMKYVGKLGKVLGPQGKMPSPKAGTVTPDVGKAVREFKAGKIEFRTDAGANIHAAIGRRSFTVDDLSANLRAFVEHLKTMRPTQAKGTFIRRVCVSMTMSPSVQVDLS